jgi:hypothetical protein
MLLVVSLVSHQGLNLFGLSRYVLTSLFRVKEIDSPVRIILFENAFT